MPSLEREHNKNDQKVESCPPLPVDRTSSPTLSARKLDKSIGVTDTDPLIHPGNYHLWLLFQGKTYDITRKGASLMITPFPLSPRTPTAKAPSSSPCSRIFGFGLIRKITHNKAHNTTSACCHKIHSSLRVELSQKISS